MGNAVDILSSGLSATRLRVNVLAANIANAETTRTDEGGPYKRRDVVQIGRQIEGSFGSTLDRISLNMPSVLGVQEDTSDPRKVYQPGHPDADTNGFVLYPNINMVTTMTDLMSASRLYQANVTALESVRQMERDAASLSTSV